MLFQVSLLAGALTSYAQATTPAPGGLDRETVRRGINLNKPKFTRCYEDALETNASLRGKIVYRWRITPAGTVDSAQVQSTNLESETLKACMKEVLLSMRFPVAGNRLPTTVLYPFVFQK